MLCKVYGHKIKAPSGVEGVDEWGGVALPQLSMGRILPQRSPAEIGFCKIRFAIEAIWWHVNFLPPFYSGCTTAMYLIVNENPHGFVQKVLIGSKPLVAVVL